jgi:hypothetical protein
MLMTKIRVLWFKSARSKEKPVAEPAFLRLFGAVV